MKKFISALLLAALFATLAYTAVFAEEEIVQTEDGVKYKLEWNEQPGGYTFSIIEKDESSTPTYGTPIAGYFSLSSGYDGQGGVMGQNQLPEGAKSAERTTAAITVDGESEFFAGYNIDGNNYFKLRDIAYVLNGSKKQFEVTWNEEKKAINLISDKQYTAAGGEMETGNYGKKAALPSDAAVYMDGSKAELTAYNINGNNYFKLRDLGATVDFSVEWNESQNRIEIETIFGYTPEDAADSYYLRRNTGVGNTNVTAVKNWGNVSPLQQFSYMDKGLAYAYINDDKLEIVTPDNNFSVPARYSLLGDVISDKDGNFYVVWGEPNEEMEPDTETVFISKYSAKGVHAATTGFVGESIMGESGNTRIPFDAGNCDSAMGKGLLMVNYAREMYSGHQSNNVIGVRMSDMSPVEFDDKWNIPYTSHSFNQRVIWSELADDFVYADHGDAYDRGFVITTGEHNNIVFHCYLEANAAYNMWVVNKTFAQLGGLAETSDGVVLVAASAKTLGERAKEEKQNLFVQIFDPLDEVSQSMFVGGQKRSGETSFDINDTSDSPLTKVTDYGVHWITNHTDKNVVAPQTVVADNRIVILWNEADEDYNAEAFYTVLSSDGEVILPAQPLGKMQLNSNEDPIYYNGQIYWACAESGRIRVLSIPVE